MLKKLFERGTPKRTDDEKLSIFLNSPIIDDLLRKQNEALLKERLRQAGEIARIDAAMNTTVAEFDAKIAAAGDGFEAARRAFETARAALQGLHYEKRSYVNQQGAARQTLVNELKQTAPMIDEFIAELRNLYFANQNLQFKETVVAQADNAFGGKTKIFTQTDPKMMGWYEKLDQTIRAAEELKLSADFTTFPEEIEKLRADIVDPDKFGPVVVTVNTSTNTRVVEGTG